MGLRGNNKRKKSTRWFPSGLTLPGYNYLGPFNAEDNGPPTNPSDAAAQKHDAAYKSIQSKHGFTTPYLKYSQADEDFINEASSADYGGRWGKSFFQWKKEHVNRLQDPTPLAKKNKLRGSNTLQSDRKRTDPFDKPATKFRAVEESIKSEAPPPTSNAMSGKPRPSGSGNDVGLTETPIDEVVNVSRGPPTYTFASLPYYKDRYVATTNAVEDFWFTQWTFRMTSPYDTNVAVTTADINAGVGVDNSVITLPDGSDAVAEKARWFDFYGSLYEYYHVISCKWSLTLENMSTEPMWVHKMYHGTTMPPAAASNQDILHWNDTESHLVGPIAHAMAIGKREVEEHEENKDNEETQTLTGPTNVNYTAGDHVASKGASNILQLSGQYSPGDFKQEIHLDSEIENWTLTNTNPTLSERLTFRIKPQWDVVPVNSATDQNRNQTYRFVFRAEYLVEFKELKYGLRYPVQQQPLTITINSDGGVL